MPRRNSHKKQRSRKRSLALTILSAVANGSLKASTVLLAASAPYPQGREIRRWQYEILQWEPNIDLEKMFRDARRRGQTTRILKEIQKRRWVQPVKKHGRMVLEITEGGKKRLVQYQVDTLSIPQQKHWDGQWRIVLFDIPEKERLGRDVLRHRLKTLGFLQLQRSAFVFPHPCEDQLDLLIHYYRLQPHVTFFTAESLGYQEARALNHFGLKLHR